jgi:hypothetical protein
VPALLVVGTVLAVIAVFAVFADRQALDADNWAQTSSDLLQNDEIRTQISAFLVDEVYANVDVDAQIAAALPPRLQPLAGPAAAGLQQAAQRVAFDALGRPRVQQAWESANRLTAQQFIAIAKDDSTAITVSGNAVILDLRSILVELVRRLGLPQGLVAQIPEGAGAIQIMSSEQISTAQGAVKLLESLAIVIPILALALMAGAVALAEGRRRRILLWVGIDLIIAGVAVLVARNLAGSAVVDALATTASVRPAAEAAWSIGTEMLRDVAQALIIGAIPIIAAAWIAGPMRVPTALRRLAAPWLRERPGVAYVILGAVLLLVVAWGPIPATRMPIPVVVMALLAVLGLEALRRQVDAEFPEATFADTRASLRHGLGGVSRTLGGSRARPTATATAGEPSSSASSASSAGHVEQLERLAVLHDHGALTDDEFAAEKMALRNGTAALS